jgi:ABC-2 type transport system ATP-binding protein
VALVAALASDVELLLLDEPTSGLDPLMDAVFRSAVEDVRREGRTVLLSSHILSEVEALADHVSIIRAGRTVETGALADMRHLSRTSVDAVPRHTGGSRVLQDVGGVEDLTTEGTRVAFTIDTAQVGEVLARLGQHGIQSLSCQPPTLSS